MINSLRTSATICVDASLVVIRVTEPSDVAVQRVWRRWRQEGRDFVAPDMIWYEVSNVLHRMTRSGTMSSTAARAAFDAALGFPIVVHAGFGLHRSALELAQRLGLPAAYDAHYLALAEHLGVEFWTADQRLFNFVSWRLPWVKLSPRSASI